MDEREHDGVSSVPCSPSAGRVKQHTVTHCSEKQENVPLVTVTDMWKKGVSLFKKNLDTYFLLLLQ